MAPGRLPVASPAKQKPAKGPLWERLGIYIFTGRKLVDPDTGRIGWVWNRPYHVPEAGRLLPHEKDRYMVIWQGADGNWVTDGSFDSQNWMSYKELRPLLTDEFIATPFAGPSLLERVLKYQENNWHPLSAEAEAECKARIETERKRTEVASREGKRAAKEELGLVKPAKQTRQTKQVTNKGAAAAAAADGPAGGGDGKKRGRPTPAGAKRLPSGKAAAAAAAKASKAAADAAAAAAAMDDDGEEEDGAAAGAGSVSEEDSDGDFVRPPKRAATAAAVAAAAAAPAAARGGKAAAAPVPAAAGGRGKKAPAASAAAAAAGGGKRAPAAPAPAAAAAAGEPSPAKKLPSKSPLKRQQKKEEEEQEAEQEQPSSSKAAALGGKAAGGSRKPRAAATGAAAGFPSTASPAHKQQRQKQAKASEAATAGAAAAAAAAAEEGGVVGWTGRVYPAALCLSPGDRLVAEYREVEDPTADYLVAAVVDEVAVGTKDHMVLVKWEGYELDPDEWCTGKDKYGPTSTDPYEDWVKTNPKPAYYTAVSDAAALAAYKRQYKQQAQ